VTTPPARTAELVADLTAEHQVLEGVLGGLSEAQWQLPTPAAGWEVRHQIAHLTFFDEVGRSSVAGDNAPFSALRHGRDGQTEHEVSLALLQPLLGLPVAGLLSRWRTAAAALRQEFLAAPPGSSVVWGAGPMSLDSFVTARLMEAWAHGLDCLAAVRITPVDTDRVRHICHLGYRALPYAFRRSGTTMPGPLDNLRLELVLPSGKPYVLGPETARSVISGPAAQWARVAVQRMPRTAAVGLVAHGELADAALKVARAFA
jgi:uncharacterized protein (TIGR03084 family)